MNNPLLFTDPSGYRPDLIFEEEQRISAGQDFGGGGGGSWDPFGWMNQWGHATGTSLGWAYDIHRANSWEYDWETGEYKNKFTGERVAAKPESTASILSDAGFEEVDYVEEGAEAVVYFFVGMGSYQDNKTALRPNILGNVEVYIPLFTATYGSYLTQSNTAGRGGEWFNPTSKAIVGLGLATKGRELLEWEYLRQARYNRSLSGNFSKPIKHSLRGIKSTGRVLGGAGIVLTGVDMGVNGINVSNSLDMVMGGVAFIPVAGWAISGTYFLANITTQLITGESIGEHIQGTFTDPNAAWKPW